MKNSLLLLAWLTVLGGLAPLNIPIAYAQTPSITPATDGTGTTVTTQGNRFDIGGGRSSDDGANLFQSFDRFGLKQGEVANFLAAPTVRNVLSRVVGGDPSMINGLVQVTGGAANLYLLNPAGIIFGANASLNVPASFTATTANGIGFGNGQWFSAIGTADYAALIGTPNTFAFTNLQPGAIANLGKLAVGQGQSLTLLGGTVLNTGQLTAPGGQITVAAVPGQTLVRLSQPGSLLSLEFSPLRTQAPLPDTSTPPTLPQLLTGGNLGNATGVTVNPDGTLQLTGSTARLSTAPGTTIVSGQVSVASNAPPATPTSLAQIAVLGDRVSLQAATLDASGLNGGTLRIGGGYQGQGTVPNARFTDVDAGTVIRADAIASIGNGGTVIVWSNDTTNVAGTLTAQGGSSGGNGGLVETSGKQTLLVSPSASVSTFAPFGQTGTWLLDPADLTVVATGGTAAIAGGANTPATAGTINAGTIVTALNGTNVNLQATNSITVNAAINASVNGTVPGSLTLTTPTVTLNQPITLTPGSTLSGTATTVNVGAAGTVQNGVDVVAIGGTVNLAAATYTLASTVSIAKSLTLNGVSAGSTTVSGNNAVPVFNLAGAGVVANLNNLTITQGASTSNGGGVVLTGGSTLNLTNSAITGNVATTGAGGGFFISNGNLNLTDSTVSNNSARLGGGLHILNGNVRIVNSTIANNAGTQNGGGINNNIGANTTVINSTIAGNSSQFGGGILMAATNATLNLSNSIVSGNATMFGGADITGAINSQGFNLIGNTAGGNGFVATDLQNVNPLLAPLGNYGGSTQTFALQAGSPAINAGTRTAAPTTDQRGVIRGFNKPGIDIGAYETSTAYLVTNTSDSSIASTGSLRAALNFTNTGAGNTVNFDTAGVFASPQTINLTGGQLTISNSVTIQGTGADRLTISGNNASRVFNLSGNNPTVTISGLTIANGNQNGVLAGGGGLLNSPGSTLTLNNSIVRNNRSSSGGGGLRNDGTMTLNNVTVRDNTNASAYGGGIDNVFGGNLTLNNSSVVNNLSPTGGGIDNFAGSTLTLNNSTVSGNSAANGNSAAIIGVGGGIYNESSTITLNNSTISGNTAGNGGGGIYNNGGIVNIGNTIVAGNTSPAGSDVSGSLNSQGFNLIGNSSGSSGFGSTDLLNVDPKLAPLGNYGGATQTLALLPGSPAIDAGGVNATTTDQRGIAAVGIRDIGAFESRGFTLTVTSGTPQSTLATFPFANPLVATVTSLFGEPVAGGSITFTAPTSGATATLTPLMASINSAGQASVNAIANAVAGAYTVTATARGVTGSALFSLSNTISPSTPQPTPQPTPQTTLPESGRRAVQQESTPTYPTPPKPVAEVGQIARIDRVDTLQTELESSITGQFTDHLELKEQPTVKSLPQIQDALQKIETEAGIKPALFYISLLSSSVTATTSEDDNQEPALSYDAAGNPVIRHVSSAEPDLVLIVVPATGSPILRKVPGVTRSKVLKLALTFRNEVADPSKTLTRSYLPSSEKLYSWLIKPIEPELKAQGIDTLMFIMDTNLRFLPLAALYDESDRKFLVEKYSVGLLPSLSLTDLRYGNVRTTQVLAAGTSTFADAAQNPLLGVKLELATIFKGDRWQGRSIRDQAFTLSNLQQQRQNQPFGIIHLATHGAFLPGKIGESYIQLSNDKLRLNQIRQMGWNNPPAELVVLSACQMALGDDDAELGFAGFAVKAGVKSALASLWNISDEGTIGLMSRFYEELRQVPTKAGALRQAQIAMLKGQVRVEDGKLQYSAAQSLTLPPELAKLSQQRFAHPYYWSAFTMIGSPW